ncbi:hypothetical protein ACIHFE_34245 [Streptomyces sp. NPDC052396]|uniref:hypothetical protein n=1 Tax=Streptomyces sp. NPDC052396 TaxID=3365689 RepID=UPI0037CEF8E2
MNGRGKFLGSGATVLAALALAGTTSLAYAAPAAHLPQPPKPKPVVTVGPAGGQDTVTCDLIAQKPHYSGGVVTGVGGIDHCTPHRPDACTTEAELWIWMPGPQQWAPAGDAGRNHACPPPRRTARSSVHCEYKREYPNYGYKTITTGAIVYGGSRDSGAADGDVLYLRCV